MTFFGGHFDDPHLLNLKPGTNYTVEEAADKLLAKSRQGVTALSEKRDWLSRDQLALVATKEVLNINGCSDESLMRGLFRRAHNPSFGHRPARPTHMGEE